VNLKRNTGKNYWKKERHLSKIRRMSASKMKIEL